MTVWRWLMCKIGFHKSLNVIQTFGAAQHIGCQHCRKEYAIHHGMQVVVPWSPAFSDLYQKMGYDTERATKRWLAALGEKKDA